MDQFVQFKKIITEYIKILDQIIILENNKLKTIAENDVNSLDKLIKDEQVYILKLKGIDIKREKLQKEMNMEDFSFSEIISAADGDEKQLLKSDYEVLLRKAEELKAASDNSKLSIELNLHKIDLLLSSLNSNADCQYVYDKNGTKPNLNTSHFASKKV
ncbi:flagellar export chaperone FlgN [Anaerovorax odorimutans]|uniref:flagellar export chaperone FlgN n=1 Tax=Anaerovorax odorimutans TaxID=109327 RepID=UPI00040F4695|nr:flagellar export chaperone FlgN [Anaerovorax odorimutans]